MSSDLLANLNNKQYEAVTAPEESVLILAGAGSGKTRVLTTRIAWLIEHNLATTNEILAVTFTNKAAKEMLARLENMLPYDLRRMWVGTFHGLCNRILRSHAEAAGLPKTFQILDSSDQLSLVKRLMKTANVDPDKVDPKQVTAFINWAKENGLRSNMVKASEDAAGIKLELYQAYERECQQQGVVDFAELLLRCYELLERNELVRVNYQKRFCHILVDEFQDTNVLQYRWLKLLAGVGRGPEGAPLNSVFAVGDDDQSIYAFRGANVGNMADFLTDFGVKDPIRLEQNYRSTKSILDAANGLISQNTSRLGKNLWTDGDVGEKILVEELSSAEDEADWVVDKIKQGKGTSSLVSWRDFAILYRTNAQSRTLEAELSARGIPYRVYGGLRFFERAEVKNLLGYLRMITNPWDDTSFLRIVNFPVRGIGAKTIESLQNAARESGQSLWATLIALEGRLPPKLEAFRDLIFNLREKAQDMGLRDVVGYVIKASGLEEHYSKDKREGEDRVANMKEVISAAEGWLANESIALDHPAFSPVSDDTPSPMEGFLTQATLEAGDKNEGANVDAVQLMTVHSAKGLEFPWVFIVGAEEGIFPHFSAVKATSAGGQGGLEEERRLMYVAITRAQTHLFFTHCRTRMMYGSTFNNPLSSFVKEIPQKLLRYESLAEDDDDDDDGWDSPRFSKRGAGYGSYGYGSGRSSSYGSGRSSSGYGSSFGRSGGSYGSNSARSGHGYGSGSSGYSESRSGSSSRGGYAGSGSSIAKAAAEKAASEIGYKPGDYVTHDKFGSGLVKSIIGSGDTTVIRIQFGTQVKDLLFRIAKTMIRPAGRS